jgi:hypothetical protein
VSVFSQRLSHGLYFQAAYTWSKGIDEGSVTFSEGAEITNSIGNPYAFLVKLNKGPSDYDVSHNYVLNFTWDLPSTLSANRLAKGLLTGWELGGIFSAHTGPPFSVRVPTDQSRSGKRSRAQERPDYNPLPGCSPNATNPSNPSNYIKLQCFSFPALGELGNVGRNTLRGPGLVEFDPSLLKNWSFHERLRLQFRAEFFNLLNHTNFQEPTTSIFDGRGRLIPSSTQLGPPTQTSSRQIQFGLKLTW